MSSILRWVITCPLHIEKLLDQELRYLGYKELKPSAGKVSLQAPIEAGFQICLWSRMANRVLLQLAEWEGKDGDSIYQNAREFNWQEHLRPNQTFSISFHGTNQHIRHPHYGAQRLKDALVDHFRELTGIRPNVDSKDPDVSFWAHLEADKLKLSLDFSGASLHQRGYRQHQGLASLKENLAAALLWQCDWPTKAKNGYALLDPMCGSGTILAEGLLMASDWAPGLIRKKFGFQSWQRFEPETWKRLRQEAIERRADGLDCLPPVIGGDHAEHALVQTKSNLQRIGLMDQVRLELKELALWEPNQENGLVLCDPPYGERMGQASEIKKIYRTLGQLREQRFQSWEFSIILSEEAPWEECLLRYDKSHPFRNGALACQLYRIFPVPNSKLSCHQKTSPLVSVKDSPFAQRLKKNLKRLQIWVNKEKIQCYRLYDKDIPEYGVAVDVYGEQIQIYEYNPPRNINLLAAEKRLLEVMQVVPKVMNCKPEKVILKKRKRQTGSNQYDRLKQTEERLVIEEGGLKFLVNLRDYLDTGLFLNHRPTRMLIREMAKGKRFLNLFCYTGTATVYAAAGGAESSVSVDLSGNYLGWAKDNLSLNKTDPKKHLLVKADCREWVRNQLGCFDLIFLDPPTFSNSKLMRGTWDVQRDYVEMLHQVVRFLDKNGILLFSTNSRKFKLERDSLPNLVFHDLSKELLPLDFARNPRIHQVWKIRHHNL
jgi:23S rRNA (guanine2445-N2)-methyltransferase / 23S rRNA (guanine2069-N7)-methyltransferase